MGTSLKVHGLKKLVKEFAKAVHHGSSVASSANAASKVIFVNKTPPAGEWAGVIDVHIEGTTDDWVDRVSKDWKKTRPADWEIQTTLKDVTAIKNIKSTTKPVDVNGKPAKAKLKGTFSLTVQCSNENMKHNGLTTFIVPKKNKSDEENIPPSKPQGKTTSSQEPALEKGLPSADFTFSMKTPLSAKTSATPAISKPMKKVVSAKMTAQIKRPATPLAGISNKPTTPPLSPSKRQNLESHYEDRKGELQPRKRPRSVDGSLDRVFGTSKENGVADENDGENQIVLPLVC
jgi:NAD-dependent histone deacetylase SIR2